MKKMMIVLLLGLGSSVCAQEWIAVTGKVVKTRSGVNNAVFYTVQVNETGKKYEANTLRPDVLKNEGIFKEAFSNGRDLFIEFDMEAKWPDAIRRIRKIELSNTNCPPVISG